MEQYVTVLNVSYVPIQYVTLTHAIKMLNRGVASVHESVPDKNFGCFPYPIIVKLVKYIHESWKYNRKPAWSKRRVLVRDKKKCAYCNNSANTIDHINPVSKGGSNTWLNTVASCKPCNSKKGDKSISEVGMTLKNKPFIPSYEHVNKLLYAIYK